LRAGTAAEGSLYELRRVRLFRKAAAARLTLGANPSPTERDDPMAKQIGAGFDLIIARDVLGAINGLQMNA
jgi:hypothetical protein